MRIVLPLLFVAAAAQAQQPPQPPQPPPCTSPESKQLDFWVGDWDLAYAGGGTGRNRITKILNGCVILEEFTGAPGTQLNGRSVSMFDRATGKWKQTWVDDAGSYLDFTGGMVDGRMIFSREATRQGTKFLQRMVFDEVRADSLKWTWQRSDDNGATWKNLWQIEYRRAKP